MIGLLLSTIMEPFGMRTLSRKFNFIKVCEPNGHHFNNYYGVFSMKCFKWDKGEIPFFAELKCTAIFCCNNLCCLEETKLLF